MKKVVKVEPIKQQKYEMADYFNNFSVEEHHLDQNYNNYDNVPELFISDLDFERSVAERKDDPEAICWTDLPINIIYKIDKVFPVQTKLRKEQLLLQLSDKHGNVISVWTPDNLKMVLKNLRGKNYIKSLGRKECITNNGRKQTYFDYQIVSV